MSMSANYHTDDLLNKHPLEIEFHDWHSEHPTSSYITLVLKQIGEGEMTVFVRHGLFGDCVAGLEGAARQLREVVAKEMVQTWGFPKRDTCPLCSEPSPHGEVHLACAHHEQYLADAAAEVA